jgi:sterol desaturase/sphingolipid hydroxylase (fatty acid hydroxylase superfamily)
MSSALFHAIFLAMFLVVGATWPRVRGQARWHRDQLLNLLNALLLFVVQITVVSRLQDVPGTGWIGLSWLEPSPLQFLTVLLVHDFCHYWVHRADHKFRLLWSFHRVHHSSEVLDATSGIRMHVVDFLQLSSLPILLFGLVFDVSSFDPWVVPAALSVGVAFEGFIHGNIAFDPQSRRARVFAMLFNHPHFHGWHHVRGTGKAGNFGNVFVVWDRVFGTGLRRRPVPVNFGLEAAERLRPTLLGLQLLRPAPRVAPVRSHSTG